MHNRVTLISNILRCLPAILLVAHFWFSGVGSGRRGGHGGLGEFGPLANELAHTGMDLERHQTEFRKHVSQQKRGFTKFESQ